MRISDWSSDVCSSDLKDSVAYADAGYTGADQRVPRKTLRWEIARRRGQIQKLPEGRQKRRIHAADLAALLVERSRADAMFAPQLRDRRAGFCRLQDSHDLDFGESRLSHGTSQRDGRCIGKSSDSTVCYGCTTYI